MDTGGLEWTASPEEVDIWAESTPQLFLLLRFSAPAILPLRQLKIHDVAPSSDWKCLAYGSLFSSVHSCSSPFVANLSVLSGYCSPDYELVVLHSQLSSQTCNSLHSSNREAASTIQITLYRTISFSHFRLSHNSNNEVCQPNNP